MSTTTATCGWSSEVAAHQRRSAYRRRYQQPSLLNKLLFELSLLPVFNPMSEFPMSTGQCPVLP